MNSTKSGADDASPWWVNDLDMVFPGSAGIEVDPRRTIDLIAEVLFKDGIWSERIETRNAYRKLRYWMASGKWDLVMVLLWQSGRTEKWPAASIRWGAEPFNAMGLPRDRAGFHIVPPTSRQICR